MMLAYKQRKTGALDEQAPPVYDVANSIPTILQLWEGIV